jgi:hypothetical protein
MFMSITTGDQMVTAFKFQSTSSESEISRDSKKGGNEAIQGLQILQETHETKGLNT